MGRIRGLETTQALPGILGFKLRVWDCDTAWEDSRLGVGVTQASVRHLLQREDSFVSCLQELLSNPPSVSVASHVCSLRPSAPEAFPHQTPMLAFAFPCLLTRTRWAPWTCLPSWLEASQGRGPQGCSSPEAPAWTCCQRTREQVASPLGL